MDILLIMVPNENTDLPCPTPNGFIVPSSLNAIAGFVKKTSNTRRTKNMME